MTTTWSTTDKTAGCALSGGNLVATFTGNNQGVRAIDRVYNGKYYWEVAFTTSPLNLGVGVCLGTTTLSTIFSASSANTSANLAGNGTITLFGTSTGINIGTFSAGGVACIALDADADLIWFRSGAAGNWNNNASNNPATGVGGISIAAFAAGPMGLYPHAGCANSSAATANFGATAFTGAVPAGFTSGFPDSTALVNRGVVTQAGVEQWGQGAPAAQVTQTALEVWGGITAGPRSALVTQIAVEQWAVPPPNLALVTQVALEQWANVPLVPSIVIRGNVAVTINTG